jgi:hypothetical protein
MQLPPDFREFIELMISANVQFVMIGGYAYNLYRNPRATGDIDFLVADDAENEARRRRVLVDFGFGTTLPPKKRRLLEAGKVIMLGRAPFRIDILTRIDGVNFSDVFETRREFEIDGLLIPVISPETLLKNKETTGRSKDAADVLELQTWLASQSNDDAD